MKIALAQINCHVGHFERNEAKIIAFIRKADEAGADLVVFPELAICGYPPLDYLDYRHFTDACLSAMERIAKHCTRIAAIVGGPSHNPVLKGKNLFNSAFLLDSGTIRSVINKSLLPTYDVFDEYRYFEPNRVFESIEVKGSRIALTICEDLWNEEDDPMYIFSPMEQLMQQQPLCIINIAASPFDYRQRDKRLGILKRNVRKFGLPLVYVNHVGAQTDILFDGGSMVLGADGNVAEELDYFKEDFRIVDTHAPGTGKELPADSDRKISDIRRALVMGIKDYFGKMNFDTAVLGLSGGVDSALVLVLAAEALGANRILPVLMPSLFSSEHSITDARALCRNLGIEPVEIPITNIYETFLSATRPSFGDMPFGLAEENMQARIRGTLLMSLSNKHGHILLNTSNKSELAVGYGTLYGDMAGGLSVLGDLYKTDVYALCRYLNREHPVIPEHILTKPPSAELRPGQKDSDSLPDYDLLDSILLRYIEGQEGPDQILKAGFDETLVTRVLRMVNASEYKRFQFMPILRVSPKAFGRGRRMPLVAKYLC